MSRGTAPLLPDGLVVVVKRECETCRMVAPLLAEIGATVYTQDDPAFPEGVPAIHDEELAVSWHHEIETVPTLIRVVGGVEVERTVGWARADWQRITGRPGLGDETHLGFRGRGIAPPALDIGPRNPGTDERPVAGLDRAQGNFGWRSAGARRHAALSITGHSRKSSRSRSLNGGSGAFR